MHTKKQAIPEKLPKKAKLKNYKKNGKANWLVSIPQQDCDEQFGTDVRFSCDATGKQLK